MPSSSKGCSVRDSHQPTHMRLHGAVVLEQREGEASPDVKLDLLKDDWLLLQGQPLGLGHQGLSKALPICSCTLIQLSFTSSCWACLGAAAFGHADKTAGRL